MKQWAGNVGGEFARGTGEKVIVAVGTTRPPKLAAVREALSLIGSCIGTGISFGIEGVEVPSGVRHTPLTREKTMAGARQRAEALVAIARERNERWKYFIGLEGGIDTVASNGSRMVFLENWAYVTDGIRGAYGQSGAILLPEALATSVVDEGSELAQAIDAFTGSTGIRDGQGAWGVLTAGLITRQDAFRIALLNAFAPFINPAVYARTPENASEGGKEGRT